MNVVALIICTMFIGHLAIVGIMALDWGYLALGTSFIVGAILTGILVAVIVRNQE